MLQDVLTYETAKNLSYSGAKYRTEVSEFSWMNQLTNPKDGTIHGPDFVVKELAANTSFEGTAKVTDPTFEAYLDPGKSIISIKFAGRLYNPDEIFERTTVDVSNNCIGFKKGITRQLLKQSNPGPMGGLKIILFTGYGKVEKWY